MGMMKTIHMIVSDAPTVEKAVEEMEETFGLLDKDLKEKVGEWFDELHTGAAS